MDLTTKDYGLRHLGALLVDVKRSNYGILSARAEERITKGYLMLLEALMDERKIPTGSGWLNRVSFKKSDDYRSA